MRVQKVCTGGRTKGSFKQEADINFIMSRYTKTGQLPNMIRRDPQYGNFANVKDYQESLNICLHAQEQFAALPSEVRKRFNHDPSLMLEFVADPKNKSELIKMGLAIDKTPQVTGNDSKESGNTKTEDSGKVKKGKLEKDE